MSNMKNDISKLQISITEIQDRNKRVELDKEWETSLFRKVSIALLTYIVMTLFMWSLGNDMPYLNSIIPTLGFVLSTLSLNTLKKLWLKNKKK